MKKRIYFIVATMALFVCLFAISVSADTIVPSTSNEYGELTTFDEAIGNTNISQLKNDGTIARTVLYDGTNYYTVPTTYILTESTKTVSGVKKEMFNLSFGEINTKLGKSFSKTSIIRSEMPADIAYICNANTESYNGCSNMIEIIISDGLRIWDNSQRKVFANCKSLVSIDVSGMILEGTNNTYSMFEYCEKLEKVVLPDAYIVNGVPVNYDTDYMFNGCKKLSEIENLQGLLKGVTSLGFKIFRDCNSMTEYDLWDGLTTIETEVFTNNTSLTSIIIPETVTKIGGSAQVFASCTSLKKIVFPSGAVSVGDYCFEKCTGLTDVWMPGEGSTFGQQVFGQCGGSSAVNFYFQTATSSVTISNTTNNKDPFITALNTDGDTRLNYSTPLSTKCEVFLGGHDYNTTYVFGSLYESAKLETGCTRDCGVAGEVVDLGVIIEEKGYSTSNINGIRSFTRGYAVNEELLAIYEEQKGVSVEIGFAFALESKYAPEGDATLSDFQINMKLKESGTALDVQNLDYIMRYKNDSYLETNVVIAGYVSENGVVTFDEIEIVSYRSLTGYVETTEGEDGSLDVSVSIDDLFGSN